MCGFHRIWLAHFATLLRAATQRRIIWSESMVFVVSWGPSSTGSISCRVMGSHRVWGMSVFGSLHPRISGVCSPLLEHPFSVPLWLPVPAHYPPTPFVRVFASAPTPCRFPDVGVLFLECLCVSIVMVVICPAASDRVEGFDKGILCPSLRLLHRSPDRVGDPFTRLLGWFDEQFSAVFPEIVAQKVKSVVGVGDHCLLH